MRRAIAVKLRLWANRLDPRGAGTLLRTTEGGVLRIGDFPLARVSVAPGAVLYQAASEPAAAPGVGGAGQRVSSGRSGEFHALDPEGLEAQALAAVTGRFWEAPYLVSTACGAAGFVSTKPTCEVCKAKLAASATAETPPVEAGETVHLLLAPEESVLQARGTACGGFGRISPAMADVTCRACTHVVAQ